MIQRPQSLFLLLAAALLGVFVFSVPTWSAGLAPSVEWLRLASYAVASLGALLALIGIALFKQREKQRSVIVTTQWVVLVLTLAVLTGLFVSPDSVPATEEMTVRYVVALLPLLAYVMLRIARWGVHRDIEKVRSADRLR